MLHFTSAPNQPHSKGVIESFIKLVESKTRTYNGQVGSGHPAERPGRVAQNWVPIDLFGQETQVPCNVKGIAEWSLERPSRGTNKRNPMQTNFLILTCGVQNPNIPRAGRVGVYGRVVSRARQDCSPTELLA